jgi:hypothetical protein
VLLRQLEGCLDQEFAFRARDEDIGINREIKPIELTVADDVGNGFAVKAALDEAPEIIIFLGAQFPVGLFLWRA